MEETNPEQFAPSWKPDDDLAYSAAYPPMGMPKAPLAGQPEQVESGVEPAYALGAPMGQQEPPGLGAPAGETVESIPAAATMTPNAEKAVLYKLVPANPESSGQGSPGEPPSPTESFVECRPAVVAWDPESTPSDWMNGEQVLDGDGKPVVNPETGEHQYITYGPGKGEHPFLTSGPGPQHGQGSELMRSRPGEPIVVNGEHLYPQYEWRPPPGTGYESPPADTPGSSELVAGRTVMAPFAPVHFEDKHGDPVVNPVTGEHLWTVYDSAPAKGQHGPPLRDARGELIVDPATGQHFYPSYVWGPPPGALPVPKSSVTPHEPAPDANGAPSINDDGQQPNRIDTPQAPKGQAPPPTGPVGGPVADPKTGKENGGGKGKGNSGEGDGKGGGNAKKDGHMAPDDNIKFDENSYRQLMSVIADMVDTIIHATFHNDIFLDKDLLLQPPGQTWEPAKKLNEWAGTFGESIDNTSTNLKNEMKQFGLTLEGGVAVFKDADGETVDLAAYSAAAFTSEYPGFNSSSG